MLCPLDAAPSALHVSPDGVRIFGSATGELLWTAGSATHRCRLGTAAVAAVAQQGTTAVAVDKAGNLGWWRRGQPLLRVGATLAGAGFSVVLAEDALSAVVYGHTLARGQERGWVERWTAGGRVGDRVLLPGVQLPRLWLRGAALWLWVDQRLERWTSGPGGWQRRLEPLPPGLPFAWSAAGHWLLVHEGRVRVVGAEGGRRVLGAAEHVERGGFLGDGRVWIQAVARTAVEERGRLREVHGAPASGAGLFVDPVAEHLVGMDRGRWLDSPLHAVPVSSPAPALVGLRLSGSGVCTVTAGEALCIWQDGQLHSRWAQEQVTGLAWSRRGRWLAAASEAGLWWLELRTGQARQRGGPAAELRWSPGGLLWVGAEDESVLLDPVSGEVLVRYCDPHGSSAEPWDAYARSGWDVLGVLDDQRVLVSAPGQGTHWLHPSGRLEPTWAGAAQAHALSPGGRWLAWWQADGTLACGAADGRSLHPEGARMLAFSADDSRCAWLDDRSQLRVHDLAAGGREPWQADLSRVLPAPVVGRPAPRPVFLDPTGATAVVWSGARGGWWCGPRGLRARVGLHGGTTRTGLPEVCQG